MGRNINVYLSEQADISLQKRKEKDPSFNTSAFFSSKLIESDVKQEDPAHLKIEVDKQKADVINIKNEIEYKEDKIRKLNAEIEKEKTEEEEKELKVKENAEIKLKNFIEDFNYYYDLPIEKVRELVDEFIPLRKETRTTLHEFMEKKGYKRKDQ